VPVAEQELVRIDGETVCVIPAIAREINHPEVIASLYDPASNGRTFRFRDGRSGILTVSRYRSPLSRWLAAIRGKSWRSRELRTARLLFHLERYAIKAPRLLAYGQSASGVANAGAFVLAEPREVRHPTAKDAASLRELLRRLHDHGCCLGGIGNRGEPFAMDGPVAAIGDIRFLRLNRRLSARRMQRDHRLLDRFLGGRR
jgi:hypothetical protein